jgi:hypothetical protein
MAVILVLSGPKVLFSDPGSIPMIWSPSWVVFVERESKSKDWVLCQALRLIPPCWRRKNVSVERRVGMKACWVIVPVGNGKFRLNNQFGEQVAIVERKRDVSAPALEYVQRYYYQNNVDDIVFEGLELIPFFPTRWIRKCKEWLFGGMCRFVAR